VTAAPPPPKRAVPAPGAVPNDSRLPLASCAAPNGLAARAAGARSLGGGGIARDRGGRGATPPTAPAPPRQAADGPAPAPPAAPPTKRAARNESLLLLLASCASPAPNGCAARVRRLGGLARDGFGRGATPPTPTPRHAADVSDMV
jgi:hypothetical protein